MPELPEVETIVNDLKPLVEGRSIAQVDLLFPRAVERPSPKAFIEAVEGKRIARLRRRGKYILLELDDGSVLAVHLRLTGRLLFNAPRDERHLKAVFYLDGGDRLVFADPRKLGRLYWAPKAEDVVGHLGPEPLDESFTPEVLAQRLNGRRCSIKGLLLDQRAIAGLGNIYTDEALFLAGIHPQRPASSLSWEEIERLHGAIQEVLRQGIERRGTTFSDYRDAFGRQGQNQASLNVFRRAGKPCPRCGTEIKRIRVAGRGTYFCPVCQPLTPYKALSPSAQEKGC